MKKIELLAPAGDMDRLKAAVSGGCDAVYLGLTNYSARAFAGNFNRDELLEAVKYCHIRGVKVYVTMNTMLLEPEMERAKDDVEFLYNADVDALLIQDFGLFHYVRTCFPDFDVHCSTQMHIHNLAGVKFMQEEGASRVVLARETPMDLVKDACKTGMEIEVFVYGAICISYSGQCLMSSALKNRSANKGMCAQCCRLKYFHEDGSSFQEGDYILSPKDLNVMDEIPQLIEAGVSSLKIEGRMKRPEYVYLVTKTFKEAIEAYYEGTSYQVSKEREKDLLLMFNRGFSKGHLFGDDVEHRMSPYRPNHRGIEIGKVLSYNHDEVTVKLSDTLYQRDGLRILNEPIDTGLTAVKIEKNGKLVNMANAGDVVKLPCKNEPHPKQGQKLLKTSDVKLLERIQNAITVEKRIPVFLHYEAKISRPFTIQIQDDQNNEIFVESDLICEMAKNRPLSKERIEDALNKTGDIPFEVHKIHGEIDEIFLPIRVLNETRRNAFEQLMIARSKRHVRKGKQPYNVVVHDSPGWNEKILVKGDQEVFLDGCKEITKDILPVIHPDAKDRQAYSYQILSSASDLYGTLQHCLAGITMNIANSYACAYLMSKEGIDGIILSSELNNEQIKMILDAYKERYQNKLFAYRLVYGHRTVMYIKDRFIKNPVHKMTDLHENQYEIRYNNGYTSILEPEAYTSDNPYCDGSVVILNGEKNSKEIIQEAYEEIY